MLNFVLVGLLFSNSCENTKTQQREENWNVLEIIHWIYSIYEWIYISTRARSVGRRTSVCKAVAFTCPNRWGHNNMSTCRYFFLTDLDSQMTMSLIGFCDSTHHSPWMVLMKRLPFFLCCLVDSSSPCRQLFTCPLSLEFMMDPVITPLVRFHISKIYVFYLSLMRLQPWQGHTFERKNIQQWLKTNGNCPITNQDVKEEVRTLS